ncbi:MULTISPECIES: phosphodiester glycosidase family protein [unclassified Streptomyces]|uniref:phosphodiester glycosidase family protein n=1 Tax=unclassified Streptomyces TaxID=2593676 RepID=UPI001EF78EBB|nr:MULTISPECIES: phosphodiester glycosidase family protein [unclassified Streptomyces]
MHLLTIDLGWPGVRAGLLHPGAVSKRDTVSRMARERGAVAAINGDFFNISEAQHHGVEVTYAASGPAVASGQPIKAAVPEGQRFGLSPPRGSTTEDVIGVGQDGVARTGRLTLEGHVQSPHGRMPLRGLNQYALPVGSVGMFTSQWGRVSRARAVCGTDERRGAPCSQDTYEVTVRDGFVRSGSPTPGTGSIAPGERVLVGREAGARLLRNLVPGTPVTIDYRLAPLGSGGAFDFALGGQVLLRDHRAAVGLDSVTAQPRSAAGIADGGRTLRLLSTDGREGRSSGLTVDELARLLAQLNCSDGVNLDGGASATLVTRDSASGHLRVRNHLAGGLERLVPNGIAITSNCTVSAPQRRCAIRAGRR